MLRNYLTVAFRNLFRQKVYSFVNIAGLANWYSDLCLDFEFCQV